MRLRSAVLSLAVEPVMGGGGISQMSFAIAESGTASDRVLGWVVRH